MMCVTELNITLCFLCSISGSNQVQEKAEYTITLKPDAAYNLIHTVLFGCLALSTMRYNIFFVVILVVIILKVFVDNIF